VTKGQSSREGDFASTISKAEVFYKEEFENNKQGGPSLRRQLAKETLARRYYELYVPGICVHIAYLRRPLQYLCTDSFSTKKRTGKKFDDGILIGGSKSKEDRIDDFLHFEQLCAELTGGGMEYPGSRVEDDFQVLLEVSKDFLAPRKKKKEEEEKTSTSSSSSKQEKEKEDRGEAGEEDGDETGGKREQTKSISDRIPLRIRYQQFTEFTSYTFDLPILEGYDSMKDGFEEGENFIKGLKGIDGWWNDIPGELFLVAVVSSRATPAKGNKILYDPLKIQTDLYHIKSDSLYPGDSPTGAIVGQMEKEMGLFVNYALQPFTDYLYVGVLYHENASSVEKQQYSRQVQRFLELEQYRLLCLSASSVAKYLFVALESINEEILQVLRDFQTARENKTNELQSSLESIIDLQSRSETLGIGIRDRFGASQAYGNVVFRRLDRLCCRMTPGVSNFDGFVRKRLEPALRTFDSAGERLDETTDTVSRASNLLRAQIDLNVQAQNENLLLLGTILSVSSFSLAIIQFIEKFDIDL
jgi:hypothetical protein